MESRFEAEFGVRNVQEVVAPMSHRLDYLNRVKSDALDEMSTILEKLFIRLVPPDRPALDLFLTVDLPQNSNVLVSFFNGLLNSHSWVLLATRQVELLRHYRDDQPNCQIPNGLNELNPMVEADGFDAVVFA